MSNTNSSAKYIELLKQALCASLYEESAWHRVEEESGWRRVEGSMRKSVGGASTTGILMARAKQSLLRYLRDRKLLLVRTEHFDSDIRNSGLDWPLFGFTMTGRRRLDALHSCVEDVLDNHVPGDFAETGVWRGGSVIFIRALLSIRNITDRVVWCADSFDGMPVPKEADQRISTSSDFSDREYLRVSLEEVKKNFERFGLLDEQVKFLKGWFSETLPTAPIGKLALLRLDGDLYESTRDALVNLYDKISTGGYIIIDDYNSWKGCHVAVDEFREKRGIAEKITQIDAHAIMWKVASTTP